MKKILILLTAITCLVPFAAKAQLDTNIQITIYASVCPAIEAGPQVWTPFVNSVQGFWAGSSTETPAIDPAGFHAITAGDWRDICVDNTGNSFPMWLGQATPSGVQHGNGITFPVKIVSTGALFALSDVRITLNSWNPPYNSLGKVTTYATFFPEVAGVNGDGTLVTSGSATKLVPEIRSVGPRAAFAAANQAGVNVVSNYVNSVSGFGVSCIVEVLRNGNVVARKQLDIPFSPPSSQCVQLGQYVYRIDGNTNQQYRLRSTPTLESGTWENFGMPIFSGDITVITSSSPSRFFRAFQGP